MTYTTIQGDTWDGIAYKLFQNESSMTLLMQTNLAHIRTVVFGAGVLLQVPEVAPAVAEDLPPWRR
nr:phage tail protein [Paenibacillus roseus]